MKKLIGVAIIAGMLTGCASLENRVTGCGQSMVGGHYIVKVWSGGKCVAEYDVNGYINTEYQSDGWYFRDNIGKYHRIAGTVTIDQQ